MNPVHAFLKEWRALNSLSMLDAAPIVGLRSSSAYQYYENPKGGFAGDHLPYRISRRLEDAAAAEKTKLPPSFAEVKVTTPFADALNGSTCAVRAILEGIADTAATEAREATDARTSIILSGIAATARDAITKHLNAKPAA